MVRGLVFLNCNMSVIEKKAENEQASTKVGLPVECEAEVEPDTETELFCDDE